MIRPSFSLRTLLLSMAFIAAVCATLRFPNQWLASAWRLTTVAVLLFSIVATALRRQRRQAFWLGFAVCGWGYFYITLWPSLHSPDVASQLATTRASTILYWVLNPNSGWAMGELPSPTLIPSTGPTLAVSAPVYQAVVPYSYDDAPSIIAPISPSNAADVAVPLDSPDRAGAEGTAPTYYPPGVTAPPLLAVIPARLYLEEYVRLGSLVWTLLFAFCGGVAGRWLHDTRQEPASP